MPKKYRVMPGFGPIGLRKSPDAADPKFGEWFNWQDGEVFTPPAHLKTIGGLTLSECVERGVLEEVR
jgi:hypothetical protein